MQKILSLLFFIGSLFTCFGYGSSQGNYGTIGAGTGGGTTVNNFFTVTNQTSGFGGVLMGGTTNATESAPGALVTYPFTGDASTGAGVGGLSASNSVPIPPGTYSYFQVYSPNLGGSVNSGTNHYAVFMTNSAGANPVATPMFVEVLGAGPQQTWINTNTIVIPSNTCAQVGFSNNQGVACSGGIYRWSMAMQVPTSIASVSATVAPSQATVTNSTYTATIYSNNIVYLNGQWTNYPSSTTSGIQETWNAIAGGLNLVGTQAIMSSATIKFAGQIFPYSTQIYIDSTNPVDIQFLGSGIDGTKLVYTGGGTPLNGDFHVGGDQGTLVFKPIDLTFKDICFSAITQQTNTIVYIGQTNTPGDFSYINFSDCNFESWQAVTNNPHGAAISKYFTLDPALNLQTPGLIGLQVNSSEEHAVVVSDCYFSGLACGASFLCDHLYMTTVNKAAYCGVSGTSIVRNTLWSSNFIFSTAAPFIFENGFQGEIDNMHIWNCAVALCLAGNSFDRFVNLVLEQNSPSPVEIIADSSSVKATVIDSYDTIGALTNAVYYMSPSGAYPGNYAITNIQNQNVVFQNSGIRSGNVFQYQQAGYWFGMTPNNGGIEGNGFTFFPDSFALQNIGAGNLYPVVTITGSISNNVAYGGPVNGVYGYSYAWTLAYPGELVLTNPASKMCIVSNDMANPPGYILEPTNEINQGNFSQLIYTPLQNTGAYSDLVGAWPTSQTGSTDNGVVGAFILQVTPLNYMSQSGFFGNGTGLTNLILLTQVRGSFGLVNATAKTIAAQCTLHVWGSVTNGGAAWLTNETSHEIAPVGLSTSGGLIDIAATNYFNVYLGCVAGDVVLFTNIDGAGNIGIQGSTTNTIE